ncbi:MAG: hypothetical protein ACI9E1_000231 [Cryomorphaceae bacterium]|jgi:hypothetical protein
MIHIMFSFWSNTQSIFLPLFLLAGLAGSSIGLADDDMEKGRKSKELVEKMKKQESELREETRKKIEGVRKLALERLEKLRKRYLSQSKQAEADSIGKEINLLRNKMGMPASGRTVARETKRSKNDNENQYFKYRTSYVFDEKGIINGKFIFMPNKKVRAIYNYRGNDVSEFWDWQDMGDHVQISAGLSLGTIIISEIPSSNLKSLLIRWGGELTNKLTDGHSE